MEVLKRREIGRCDIASFPLVEVVQVSVSFSAYMRRSGSEKSDRSLSFFFVSSRLILMDVARSYDVACWYG